VAKESKRRKRSKARGRPSLLVGGPETSGKKKVVLKSSEPRGKKRGRHERVREGGSGKREVKRSEVHPKKKERGEDRERPWGRGRGKMLYLNLG